MLRRACRAVLAEYARTGRHAACLDLVRSMRSAGIAPDFRVHSIIAAASRNATATSSSYTPAAPAAPAVRDDGQRGTDRRPPAPMALSPPLPRPLLSTTLRSFAAAEWVPKDLASAAQDACFWQDHLRRGHASIVTMLEIMLRRVLSHRPRSLYIYSEALRFQHYLHDYGRPWYATLPLLVVLSRDPLYASLFSDKSLIQQSLHEFVAHRIVSHLIPTIVSLVREAAAHADPTGANGTPAATAPPDADLPLGCNPFGVIRAGSAGAEPALSPVSMDLFNVLMESTLRRITNLQPGQFLSLCTTQEMLLQAVDMNLRPLPRAVGEFQLRHVSTYGDSRMLRRFLRFLSALPGGATITSGAWLTAASAVARRGSMDDLQAILDAAATCLGRAPADLLAEPDFCLLSLEALAHAGRLDDARAEYDRVLGRSITNLNKASMTGLLACAAARAGHVDAALDIAARVYDSQSLENGLASQDWAVPLMQALCDSNNLPAATRLFELIKLHTHGQLPIYALAKHAAIVVGTSGLDEAMATMQHALHTSANMKHQLLAAEHLAYGVGLHGKPDDFAALPHRLKSLQRLTAPHEDRLCAMLANGFFKRPVDQRDWAVLAVRARSCRVPAIIGAPLMLPTPPLFRSMQAFCANLLRVRDEKSERAMPAIAIETARCGNTSVSELVEGTLAIGQRTGMATKFAADLSYWLVATGRLSDGIAFVQQFGERARAQGGKDAEDPRSYLAIIMVRAAFHGPPQFALCDETVSDRVIDAIVAANLVAPGDALSSIRRAFLLAETRADSAQARSLMRLLDAVWPAVADTLQAPLNLPSRPVKLYADDDDEALNDATAAVGVPSTAGGFTRLAIIQREFFLAHMQDGLADPIGRAVRALQQLSRLPSPLEGRSTMLLIAAATLRLRNGEAALAFYRWASASGAATQHLRNICVGVILYARCMDAALQLPFPGPRQWAKLNVISAAFVSTFESSMRLLSEAGLLGAHGLAQSVLHLIMDAAATLCIPDAASAILRYACRTWPTRRFGEIAPAVRAATLSAEFRLFYDLDEAVASALRTGRALWHHVGTTELLTYSRADVALPAMLLERLIFRCSEKHAVHHVYRLLRLMHSLYQVEPRTLVWLLRKHLVKRNGTGAMQVLRFAHAHQLPCLPVMVAFAVRSLSEQPGARRICGARRPCAGARLIVGLAQRRRPECANCSAFATRTYRLPVCRPSFSAHAYASRPPRAMRRPSWR